MARTLRRKTVLSRLFTTYLTLVIVVMFTGIAGAAPVPAVEEDTPELIGETAAPESDVAPQVAEPLQAPVDEGPAAAEAAEPEAQRPLAATAVLPAATPAGAAAPACVVSGPGAITVIKFEDTNKNGVKDPSEALLKDWEIILKDSKGKEVARKITDANGKAVFDKLVLGTYQVSETLQAGWETTTPQPISVTLNECNKTKTVYIGNLKTPPPPGKITVYKFEDTNKNGKKDAGERLLEGWEIILKDSKGAEVARKATDASGKAVFDGLAYGTYKVSETMQDGWETTTAQPVKVELSKSCKTADVYIGNYMKPPPARPSIAIEKSTTTPNYSAVGDVISYSYKVTNNGNVTLSAPWSVLDDVVGPVDVSGAPATLAPEAHFTVTATHTVTQADIDAGSVTNVAYATGTYNKKTVTSPEDTVTVVGLKNPELTLSKDASPLTYAAVGEIITYTYTLKNTGNVTLHGPFTVDDDKATVIPDDPSLMVLGPGASATFTAHYTITQADLDAGSVTNIAQGHGYYGQEPIDSNEAEKTVLAEQRPALSLAKSASPATYEVEGAVITYTYTLKNTGNVTLHGPFTVDDDKATTSRVGAVPDPDVLAPGDSPITFEAHYTITQDDLDAGSVTNVAQGRGYFGESAVDSNEDDETVAAIPAPALELIKEAVPTSAPEATARMLSSSTVTYSYVGEIITYTYTLKNTGNVTLHGPFTVDDDKATVIPDDPSLMVLGPGASATFTAHYTITQADLDAGSVTNIAQGHGYYGQEPIDSNEAEKTVLAEQRPALSLAKSASPATYEVEGAVITYTYTLKNTGNVTLHGPFTVDDDKATTSRVGAVPDPDVLAPGDSPTTFAAHYTITQADLDAGSVTNIAQGHGYYREDPVDSNEDDETVWAEQNPVIEIEKLTNGEDGLLIAAGADVTWSYRVSNTGNVTLSNIVVTDDVIGEIGAIESLAPGESETLYAHGTAIAGLYENVGTAEGMPPAGEGTVSDSDDSSYYGADPAISVVKSVDKDLVLEGESVVYTFVVRNTGNVPLYDVTVVDDHLGTIAEIEMLAVGAELTFTKTAEILVPTTNIVVATGVDGVGQEVSDSDEAFVDVEEFLEFPPDLKIDKTADRSSANPGDTITYTLVIKNVGGAAATDFTVVDTFDKDHLTVVDAGGGTVAGNQITWTFPGPLASGESKTITYKMMVSKTMPAGRTVVPNKVVVSIAGDEDTTNNTSKWDITVNVKPEKGEPYLPFTGADIIGLLALAGATGFAGVQLRRRGRKS